jgi:hypothetical protein
MPIDQWCYVSLESTCGGDYPDCIVHWRSWRDVHCTQAFSTDAWLRCAPALCCWQSARIPDVTVMAVVMPVVV